MLTRDADGRPYIEIADAKGELHSYRVAREDLRGGATVLRLSRFEPGVEETLDYEVTLGPGGRAACTCRAFEFSKAAPKTCKHLRRCRELLNMLAAARALTGV